MSSLRLTKTPALAMPLSRLEQLALMVSYLKRLAAIKVLRVLAHFAQGLGRLIYPTLPKPSSSTHYFSDGRKLRMDIYLPHSSPPNSLIPIHINIHGSGWCLPGFHQDDPFCDHIAKAVGCVVLNADYSKSPEHMWPAANNDTDAAIRWARANARQRGWDPERISIGGFSAGGNLALSAAIGEEGRDLKAVVAFYCPTNVVQPAHEKLAPKLAKGQSGVPLTTPAMGLFIDCYAPLPIDRMQPRISPMYAAPTFFPPSVTIISGGADPLTPEARALAEKLAAERDVVFFDAPGQGHAWDKVAKPGTQGGKLKDVAYALVVERLKKALQPSDSSH